MGGTFNFRIAVTGSNPGNINLSEVELLTNVVSETYRKNTVETDLLGEMKNKVAAWEPVTSGSDHIRLLLASASFVRAESEKHLKSCIDDCAMIGTAMSALYQAATCHRGCNGGPHVFEAVCWRAYNLACAAYILALSGLYDEAASLIRTSRTLFRFRLGTENCLSNGLGRMRKHANATSVR